MTSILRMNFLLNIDTYPIPIVVCKTLMENWDHIIYPY